MRVTCKHCGRAHPSYECKYRDTKSTAAGKAPPSQKALGQSALNAEGAGTQALPVDTNPERPEASLSLSSHGEFLPPSAGTGEDKDRQPKFDKVAYQREYMRKWRAARGKPA